MVFIDYQNLYISMKNHMYAKSKKTFNINFYKLAQELNEIVKERLSSVLVKTYLFAYQPCDKLLELPEQRQYYDWLLKQKNNNYFEVIEGRQEIRNISDEIPIDINDRSTYTTIEKGTDVNLAVTMLSKAYTNAFDIAILVSGDSDYIPAVEILHQLGKVVIIASVQGQNITKYNTLKDAHINIDLKLLQKCAVPRGRD